MCNQFEGQTTVVLDQQTVRPLLLYDLVDVILFLMLLKLAACAFELADLIAVPVTPL